MDPAIIDNLEFYKMSGSGNDFILIDNRSGIIGNDIAPALAQAVCRRGVSVGADGLILVENSTRADFKWDFLNSDGSRAEMCGNGGRCAARFAILKGLAGSKLTFETLAGLIQAEVNGGLVTLTLPPPGAARLDFPVSTAEGMLTVSFINTGVPHAIILVSDINAAKVKETGREIRFHQDFAPAGTNVNFVSVLDPHHIRVRTYERGVEDETLACGTGSTASALITGLKGLVKSPVAVTTTGGEILTVHFTIDGSTVTDLKLTGSARVDYEGKFTRETVFAP
ncbi:MAG: diaminopimelate epimerase [Deltaproteobacteria bacterium]|nr:diaminopimelate epimerase [Deltaproteobacteria bacterium]